MGQLERYGLYVLCLVIFLILGVAIWGDEGAAAKGLSANVANNETPEKGTQASGDGQLETEEQKLAKFESFLREQKKDALDKQKAAEALFHPAEDDPGGAGTKQPTEDPPPKPAPVVELTHTVRKDDNLEAIAQRYLGKRHMWRKILAVNPDVNPRRLKLGTVLKIPVVDASARGTSGEKKVTNASGHTYRVRRGDSAWSIAKKYYGENKASEYAKRILDLNAISDAGALKPGTSINLPR